MPDFDQFQVGNVVYPLSTTSERSLLQDADPALFYALDYWTFVIESSVGARLVQALSRANVRWPSHAPGPLERAVSQAYPYEPLPQFLESQFAFPLLCVYRTELQTEWRSVGWETDSTALELLYVLPPLDAAQTEQVLPIFNAIKSALRRKTTDAWDPAYTPPGGNPGDQFDASAFGGVEEIGFGEDRRNGRGLMRMGAYGYLPAGERQNIFFPTLRMLAYVRERDMYNPTQGGPSKFAGADITGNVATEDGTKVLAATSGVVQVSTFLPPSISGISPTSGVAAGGQAVDITGSGFLSGPPQVFFGPASNPQYATSVALIAPNALLVYAPPLSGAGGAVDVTVVNRDGQQATIKQAFTPT